MPVAILDISITFTMCDDCEEILHSDSDNAFHMRSAWRTIGRVSQSWFLSQLTAIAKKPYLRASGNVAFLTRTVCWSVRRRVSFTTCDDCEGRRTIGWGVPRRVSFTTVTFAEKSQEIRNKLKRQELTNVDKIWPLIQKRGSEIWWRSGRLQDCRNKRYSSRRPDSTLLPDRTQFFMCHRFVTKVLTTAKTSEITWFYLTCLWLHFWRIPNTSCKQEKIRSNYIWVPLWKKLRSNDVLILSNEVQSVVLNSQETREWGEGQMR